MAKKDKKVVVTRTTNGGYRFFYACDYDRLTTYDGNGDVHDSREYPIALEVWCRSAKNYIGTLGMKMNTKQMFNITLLKNGVKITGIGKPEKLKKGITI